MVLKLSFLGCLAALILIYCAPLWLLSLRRRRMKIGGNAGSVIRPTDRPAHHSCPRLTLIVPIKDESLQLPRKLENIAGLEYPRELLNVIIVDAHSTDGSEEIVHTFARLHPELKLRLLVSPEGGKLPQLNHALATCREAELIAISDADAQLPDAQSLIHAAEYFRLNPRLQVLGAWTLPKGPHVAGAEIAYWDKQNRERYLESSVVSASIVVAPFYAFRRSLLKSFPEDCACDDVFAAFAAHLKRGLVYYASDLEAHELRSPETLPQMVVHKLRKANTYGRELLRHAPHFRQMEPLTALMLYAKLVQFFFGPLISLFSPILALKLMFSGQSLVVFAGLGVLVLAFLSASFQLTPPPGRRRGGISLLSLVRTLQYLTVVNAALTINVFTSSVWRSNSQYSRLRSRMAASRSGGHGITHGSHVDYPLLSAPILKID